MTDYYQGNYKRLLLIPAIIFIFLLIAVFVFPGIKVGIDLTGGNVIVVTSDKPLNATDIEAVLKKDFSLPELKVSTITSPTNYGAWITYSKNPVTAHAEDLIAQAERVLDDENASMALSNQAIVALGKEKQDFANSRLALNGAQQALTDYQQAFIQKFEETLIKGLSLGSNVTFQQKEVSPTFGSASLQSALTVAIIAALAICLVVFISFREFVPSAAIIQAMIFDVLAGMAGMALLGIPLSLASITALLMLMGYSIDTDIMLTSRMLKRKGSSASHRASESVITGLMMTGTAFAAVTVMLVISNYYQIELIAQISGVLFFGLIGDVIATWLGNAPILLWYLEHKHKRAQS